MPLVVASSVLGLALAVSPVDAAESRFHFFPFACDGTNQHIEYVVSGLGNSVTRLIQGAEIVVIDTVGALRYMVLRAQGDEKKQLLAIGPGATRADAQFTGFLQVPTNSAGQVLFTVEAGCVGPPDTIQALVTVWFF
jgi:hypothetical protein